jgi:hypothetical protein
MVSCVRRALESVVMDGAEAGSVAVCGALDEAPVHRIALRGGDLDASILTYGATIQALRVHGPRGPRHVVLGFDSCAEYLAQRMYMGAVAGRFANRIAAGRFSLDGVDYQLTRNENGVNHLHGGARGFSRRVWSIAQVTDRAVELSLLSPAGEEGYPGTLTATCRYSIEGERCLRIALCAVTDAPTIVNLATHSYFNLAGEGDILAHRLQIPPASPGLASIFAPCVRCGCRMRRSATTTRWCWRRRKRDCARPRASKAVVSRSSCGRPSRACSCTTAARCARSPAAAGQPIGRSAGCVSSRSAFRTRPIGRASPTARCARGRRTGRSPNTASN